MIPREQRRRLALDDRVCHRWRYVGKLGHKAVISIEWNDSTFTLPAFSYVSILVTLPNIYFQDNENTLDYCKGSPDRTSCSADHVTLCGIKR
jgi:hypothetical protein